MPNHQDLETYRWKILSSRERNPERPFFYAVITTGIFCRPGCPSRFPKQENVRFFETSHAALQSGYRPCKRCNPLDNNDPQTELVISACRLIEANPEQGNLGALSATLGYTSTHIQKTFRQLVGITPFEYAKTLRQRRIYRELKRNPTSTDALHQAGYQSSSQFYAEFKEFSSLPPGSHRQSGKGEVLTFAVADTVLGALVVAASKKGLCWISLGDDPNSQVEALQRHFSRANFCPPDSEFNRWVSLVSGLIKNPEMTLTIPLDIRGTVFQRQVWEALQSIPIGTTLDYQALADKVGRPGAARAVAGACAANVLAIAVPCHRIIRRDGGLSGYRWGVDRKAWLLELEQTVVRDNHSE